MPSFSTSTRIDAPPERVFDASSDFGNCADVIEAIIKCEVLTEGPIGVGTKIAETRKMFGKEHTEVMEISRFERPRGYTMTCDSCGCHYETSMNIRPDGDGSIIECTFDATPFGFVAKMLSPLSKMMGNSCMKMVAKDFDDLKRSIEGSDAGAGAQPATA